MTATNKINEPEENEPEELLVLDEDLLDTDMEGLQISPTLFSVF